MLDLLERDPALGVQLVAEGGRLRGFAGLHACVDTLIADRILVMNDLFVDPSLRNRGVGAALYDASLAYATAGSLGFLQRDGQAQVTDTALTASPFPSTR